MVERSLEKQDGIFLSGSQITKLRKYLGKERASYVESGTEIFLITVLSTKEPNCLYCCVHKPNLPIVKGAPLPFHMDFYFDPDSGKILQSSSADLNYVQNFIDGFKTAQF